MDNLKPLYYSVEAVGELANKFAEYDKADEEAFAIRDNEMANAAADAYDVGTEQYNNALDIIRKQTLRDRSQKQSESLGILSGDILAALGGEVDEYLGSKNVMKFVGNMQDAANLLAAEDFFASAGGRDSEHEGMMSLAADYGATIEGLVTDLQGKIIELTNEGIDIPKSMMESYESGVKALAATGKGTWAIQQTAIELAKAANDENSAFHDEALSTVEQILHGDFFENPAVEEAFESALRATRYDKTLQEEDFDKMTGTSGDIQVGETDKMDIYKGGGATEGYRYGVGKEKVDHSKEAAEKMEEAAKYTVKQGDGWFAAARELFGKEPTWEDVDKLKALNPELAQRGLNPGDIIIGSEGGASGESTKYAGDKELSDGNGTVYEGGGVTKGYAYGRGVGKSATSGEKDLQGKRLEQADSTMAGAPLVSKADYRKPSIVEQTKPFGEAFVDAVSDTASNAGKGLKKLGHFLFGDPEKEAEIGENIYRAQENAQNLQNDQLLNQNVVQARETPTDVGENHGPDVIGLLGTAGKYAGNLLSFLGLAPMTTNAAEVEEVTPTEQTPGSGAQYDVNREARIEMAGPGNSGMNLNWPSYFNKYLAPNETLPLSEGTKEVPSDLFSTPDYSGGNQFQAPTATSPEELPHYRPEDQAILVQSYEGVTTAADGLSSGLDAAASAVDGFSSSLEAETPEVEASVVPEESYRVGSADTTVDSGQTADSIQGAVDGVSVDGGGLMSKISSVIGGAISAGGEAGAQEGGAATQSKISGVMSSLSVPETTVNAPVHVHPQVTVDTVSVGVGATSGGTGSSLVTVGGIAQNAAGGLVGSAELSWLAEEGYPEMVIPFAPHRRSRALELLAQAEDALGVSKHANGGVVGGMLPDGGDGESGSDSGSSSNKGTVNVGGINFSINANGGGDIVTQIQGRSAEITEIVTNALADALEQAYENTPLAAG